MHLCLCEKGIVQDCESNGGSGEGAGDHCDIEWEGIGHPALVADQAESVSQLCDVHSSKYGCIVGEDGICDVCAGVFGGHQIGYWVDLAWTIAKMIPARIDGIESQKGLLEQLIKTEANATKMTDKRNFIKLYS